MVRRNAPNIVLVVADDLGCGDLGPYGARLIRTKNIDQLARRGLVCDAMYAPASTDTPSRAGVFTGRYGARFNLPQSLQPGMSGGLPADVPTIASVLQNQGYATGLFGQWRLGSDEGHHPLDHGFDRFAGTLYGSDVAALSWHEDREQVDVEINLGSTSSRLTEAASQFVQSVAQGPKQGPSPYLAVLSYLVPHAPYEPDANHHGRSRAGSYGDIVEHLDDLLGDFLRVLRRHQRRGSDTLIIITSDGGPRFEGNNLERRGRKPEVMDGGVVVPFIASWLTGPPIRGGNDDVPRSLLDLMPTLCALAQTDPPSNIDGEDLSELVTGDDPAERGPVFVYYNEWLNAMRAGRWKLHVAYGEGARTYMPALYDIHRDYRETNNLAELYPNIVTQLADQLEAVEQDVSAEAASRASGGSS